MSVTLRQGNCAPTCVSAYNSAVSACAAIVLSPHECRLLQPYGMYDADFDANAVN